MMTVYIVDLLEAALAWLILSLWMSNQPAKPLQFLFFVLELQNGSLNWQITDYTFAVTTVFEYGLIDAIWNARWNVMERAEEIK